MKKLLWQNVYFHFASFFLSLLINTLNEKSGFVSCYWNENSDDENRIKDLTKATLRCYLIDTDKKEKSVNEKSKDGRLAIFSKAY